MPDALQSMRESLETSERTPENVELILRNLRDGLAALPDGDQVDHEWAERTFPPDGTDSISRCLLDPVLPDKEDRDAAWRIEEIAPGVLGYFGPEELALQAFETDRQARALAEDRQKLI